MIRWLVSAILFSCCCCFGAMEFDGGDALQAVVGVGANTIELWAQTNVTWHHYCEIGSTQYMDGAVQAFDNTLWTYVDDTLTITGFVGEAAFASCYNRALTAGEINGLYARHALYLNHTTATNNLAALRGAVEPLDMINGTNTLMFADPLTHPAYASGQAVTSAWSSVQSITITPVGNPIQREP